VKLWPVHRHIQTLTTSHDLRQHGFQPHADDVIVAVPPKSGTTMLLQACHQLRMKGRWGGEVDFEDQMDAKLRKNMLGTKNEVVCLLGGWDRRGIVMFGISIYIYCFFITFNLGRNGNCHPASVWKMERARVLKFQMAAFPAIPQQANCKHFYIEVSPVPKLFNTWNNHLKDLEGHEKSTSPT